MSGWQQSGEDVLEHNEQVTPSNLGAAGDLGIAPSLARGRLARSKLAHGSLGWGLRWSMHIQADLHSSKDHDTTSFCTASFDTTSFSTTSFSTTSFYDTTSTTLLVQTISSLQIATLQVATQLASEGVHG
ncbi:MAG: hypothetical protein AAF708_22705 [Deinococcota bacterium]